MRISGHCLRIPPVALRRGYIDQPVPHARRDRVHPFGVGGGLAHHRALIRVLQDDLHPTHRRGAVLPGDSAADHRLQGRGRGSRAGRSRTARQPQHRQQQDRARQGHPQPAPPHRRRRPGRDARHPSYNVPHSHPSKPPPLKLKTAIRLPRTQRGQLLPKASSYVLTTGHGRLTTRHRRPGIQHGLGHDGPAVRAFGQCAPRRAQSGRPRGIAQQIHDRRGESRPASRPPRDCGPASRQCPRSPRAVETTAWPIASASTIFNRVPPPIRKGTMLTPLRHAYGRTSSTRPVTVMPRRRRQGAHRGRRFRADDQPARRRQRAAGSAARSSRHNRARRHGSGNRPSCR